MCTAILNGGYAGRNLDVFHGYKEELIITPRHFTLPFRKTENIREHHAIIGIGTVERGYPLYFDAMNEQGLYMAGLNYVGNAKYGAPREGMTNLTPYELIPYVLGTCASLNEAKSALENINLVDIPFSREISTSELHFFIADKNGALTAEPDEEKLNLYENEVGVLTNNPPFPIQMHNLIKYAHLCNGEAVNHFPEQIPINAYSGGMGAIGLAGDLSSESRFVRAAFHSLNSQNSHTPCDFFHLLSSVEMPRGSLKLHGEYEYTAYASCADLDGNIYYYKTYSSATICSLSLCGKNITGQTLIRYPLLTQPPTEQ